MRMPLQTIPAAPNAVYIPMIMFQTGIMNGKLQTSCQLQLSAGKVTNPDTANESWISTGQTKTIYISDLANLESDLAGLAAMMNKLNDGIQQIVAAINSTRKLL